MSDTQVQQTAICCLYLQNKCTKGDSCWYRHSDEPGICSKGLNCYFKHGQSGATETQQEVRPLCTFYLQNKCNKGDSCWYRHSDENGASTRDDEEPQQSRHKLGKLHPVGNQANDESSAKETSANLVSRPHQGSKGNAKSKGKCVKTDQGANAEEAVPQSRNISAGGDIGEGINHNQGHDPIRRTRSMTTKDALQCTQSTPTEEAMQTPHTMMLSRQTTTGADEVASALLMYKTSLDVHRCEPVGGPPDPRCQHNVVNISGGLLYLGGVNHHGAFGADAYVAHFKSGYTRIPTIRLQVCCNQGAL